MSGDHPDLPILSHSFPTRRSSDLALDQVLEREFAQRGVRQAQYQLQVGAAVFAPLQQTRKAFAQQPGGQTMQQSDAIRQVQERSEEHTSELQPLMRTSYAVFCLQKKRTTTVTNHTHIHHRH